MQGKKHIHESGHEFMIDVLSVNSSQAEAVECAPDIKGEPHEDKIERQEESEGSNANNDDSTNPTKESQMEKKDPSEPRPEREKSGMATLAKESRRSGPGRPPLNKVSPMTPQQLAERKRALARTDYQKKKDLLRANYQENKDYFRALGRANYQKKKDFFRSQAISESRVDGATLAHEQEEETLTIREDEQAGNILADLDDIVIPMMDKDACADIAEDDDSTNPTKESRMEKKNPNEPRPERSGVGEKSKIETLAKDDEMKEKPRDDKIADVITLDDEQEGGEDALTRAVEGEQFGNSELKVLEKEPSDPQEQSEHNKNIEAKTNVLPKILGSLSKPNDNTYEENRKQKVNSEDNVCRTEEQSPSATSLRLVSLANLVPKSPPSPTQPIIDPTRSWTVAEVVKPDVVHFIIHNFPQGDPLAQDPCPALRASDVVPDTPIPQV